MTQLHKPERGKIVVVTIIPDCDFCLHLEGQHTPGPYDFLTSMGSWANGCERHWREYRVTPNLGVGSGQMWITADQVAQ